MEMDGDILYNENCKKAAKVIKMREKWKRNADRYYLRNREKVLEKYRGSTMITTPTELNHTDELNKMEEYNIKFD
jgi:hypothetical protein